jgi:hypothetical protein
LAYNVIPGLPSDLKQPELFLKLLQRWLLAEQTNGAKVLRRTHVNTSRCAGACSPPDSGSWRLRNSSSSRECRSADIPHCSSCRDEPLWGKANKLDKKARFWL